MVSIVSFEEVNSGWVQATLMDYLAILFKIFAWSTKKLKS